MFVAPLFFLILFVSVAFHPFGLQIVVAFAEKLRFYSLLTDDMRQEYEFPTKNCREVRLIFVYLY